MHFNTSEADRTLNYTLQNKNQPDFKVIYQVNMQNATYG